MTRFKTNARTGARVYQDEDIRSGRAAEEEARQLRREADDEDQLLDDVALQQAGLMGWWPPMLGCRVTACVLALLAVGVSTSSLGVWKTRAALVACFLYSFDMLGGGLGGDTPWSPTRATLLPALNDILLPRGEKNWYQLAGRMTLAPPAAKGLMVLGEAVGHAFAWPLLLVAMLPAWGESLLPGVLAALLYLWHCQCYPLWICPREAFLMARCRSSCDDLTAAKDNQIAQTALLVLVILGFGVSVASGALSETMFVLAVAAHGSANVTIRASLGLWCGGRGERLARDDGEGLLIAAEQRLLELSITCAAVIWWLGRDNKPTAQKVLAPSSPTAFLSHLDNLGLQAGDYVLALYLCVAAAIAMRATLAGVEWAEVWKTRGERRWKVGGVYVLRENTEDARAALDKATPLGVVLSTCGFN